MANNPAQETLKSSGESARKGPSKLRAIIVGLLLLQVAAAAVVLLNRPTSAPNRDSDDTVEEVTARGVEAQNRGRSDLAERAFLQALEMEPDNKIANYNMGVVEESKGPGNKAEDYYLKALASDPSFVPALFNLAINREEAGRPQEAADLYRKIIELEPAMAKAHLNLGFVLVRKLGQADEGRKELAKAIVLDESLAARVPKEELQG